MTFVRTAAVVAASLTMLGTNAAYADIIQVWDSLEGPTPWTRWQGGGDGDGVAGYDINGGVALYGANNGWLYVGNGWAANRIPVNIGHWQRHNCAAAVSVNVLAPGAFVGLQIWNPNGWTIIAETYPWIVGNGTGYHQIAIGNLNLSRFGTVYLQVIYGNSDNIKKFVRFDDMVLQCSY
ncbi:hypothetical protein [Myxococcus sp. SDU36]|uniref:hypothetical protein n=1 Tax=Myxococcus sp. SDU36 TaxID=2831967 RepID=UPI002543A68F|nr:hypothetical protein [Myxococcus sp. SDU36]WIG95688.1 hypothetical protein KGD87_35345 [Myxococcus sp. SDU36]